MESLLHKWLRQNVATYNDGNRVLIDVDSTLTLYPTVYSPLMCPKRYFLTIISSICHRDMYSL
jgi:hypothetical protein